MSEDEARHLQPRMATGSLPDGQPHLDKGWEHGKRVGKENSQLDPRHDRIAIASALELSTQTC